MRPGGELGAPVERDRSAGGLGQGLQARDQGLHDRLGGPVCVLRQDGEAADALDQRGHVRLAELFAKHHQVTFPMPELLAFGDLHGPQRNAVFIAEFAAVVASRAARSATPPVLRQVPIKRLGPAISGIGVAVDGLVADGRGMTLKPHPARNLLGRPSGLETVDHRSLHDGVSDQLAMDGTALLVRPLRGHTVVAAQMGYLIIHEAIAPHLPVKRGRRAAEPQCDFFHRQFRFTPPRELLTLFDVQMCVAGAHQLLSM